MEMAGNIDLGHDSIFWEGLHVGSHECACMICDFFSNYFSEDMEIAGKAIGKASKFACVRASAVIDAPLDQVLFWVFFWVFFGWVPCHVTGVLDWFELDIWGGYDS